ncbi:uncharacterized protein LOC141657402 [Silene latifolia]|uniref:uncharacterized protein LOC141657402 n=1 Tax=Silene latifolia TaxID=37657 RepID=UPI003D78005F
MLESYSFSTLFGLENYWCKTLLLPKALVKLLNKFCRNYLWHNSVENQKIYMKSWATCCCPWEEGGLNIKEILSWNRAHLCKWVWRMLNPPVSLWTTWNAEYNMKNSTIWTANISPHHSESWRSILTTRDFLLHMYGNAAKAEEQLISCVDATGRFQVAKIYEHIRPHYARVRWAKAIWNSSIIPKYSFICSLAVQKKLLTVDNINRHGLCLMNRCTLCRRSSETHTHLFFKCEFTDALWRRLLGWMQVMGRTNDLRTELTWCTSRRRHKHWKMNWFRCCLSAAIYVIWQERNARLFAEKESSLSNLVKQIQFVVGVRILDRHSKISDEVVAHLNSIYG